MSNESLDFIFSHLDQDAQESFIDTMFSWAAKNGHVRTLQRLKHFFPNMNHQDEKGMTPLMHAAHGNQLQAIKQLISYGVDVNVEDNKGRTALLYATHTVKWVYNSNIPTRWEHNNWIIKPEKKDLPCSTECIEALLRADWITLDYVARNLNPLKDPYRSGNDKGLNFLTNALLPAIRAECQQCVKLLATTDTLRYENGAAVLKMLGTKCNPKIHKIVKTACTTRFDTSTLKGVAGGVIRTQLRRVNDLSLYITVKDLPLPQGLREYLLDTSNIVDPWKRAIRQGQKRSKARREIIYSDDEDEKQTSDDDEQGILDPRYVLHTGLVMDETQRYIQDRRDGKYV